MCAKIREVFTVRLKNNIKYTVLVLTALILISVLSGCLTDKTDKTENTLNYSIYVEESKLGVHYYLKAEKLMGEKSHAFYSLEENNFNKSIEIGKEMVKSWRNASQHFSNAARFTDDENQKKAMELLAEAAEYRAKSGEKRIIATEYYPKIVDTPNEDYQKWKKFDDETRAYYSKAEELMAEAVKYYKMEGIE